MNAYPMANGAALGGGLAQFSAGFSNPSVLDAYSIRMDHAMSPKLTLFGCYNYSPSSLDQRGPPFSAGSVLSLLQSLSSSIQTATIGVTAIITPGISNELRANYSNQRVGTKSALDNFGGAVPIPDSLLIPRGYSSATGLFQFAIAGAGQYTQGNRGTNEQRQVNFIDSLSMTNGGHQLKFGVDYRWLAPFSDPFLSSQFVFFSGIATTPGGARSGSASFAQSNAFQPNALLAQNFSLYGQDTWKITHGVTLTYGLRWDVRYSRSQRSTRRTGEALHDQQDDRTSHSDR